MTDRQQRFIDEAVVQLPLEHALSSEDGICSYTGCREDFWHQEVVFRLSGGLNEEDIQAYIDLCKEVWDIKNLQYFFVIKKKIYLLYVNYESIGGSDSLGQFLALPTKPNLFKGFMKHYYRVKEEGLLEGHRAAMVAASLTNHKQYDMASWFPMFYSLKSSEVGPFYFYDKNYKKDHVFDHNSSIQKQVYCQYPLVPTDDDIDPDKIKSYKELYILIVKDCLKRHLFFVLNTNRRAWVSDDDVISDSILKEKIPETRRYSEVKGDIEFLRTELFNLTKQNDLERVSRPVKRPLRKSLIGGKKRALLPKGRKRAKSLRPVAVGRRKSSLVRARPLS